MSRALIVLFLLLFLPLPALGGKPLPAEVKSFLGSRQVVGTVHFAEGSAALGPAAKREIDRIVPRLREIDPAKTLVRIEGFASPGGGDSVNVPISMTRAKAVIDYIRNQYHLAADLFLTGFGARQSASLANEQSCRAEIALYDNIWQMSNVTVEKAVQR